MKKRVIVFGLLALLLITTLLAGCGGGGNDTFVPPGVQTTTNTGATTSQTGATPEPKVTVAPTTQTGDDNLATILNQAGEFPTVYYEMTVSMPGQPETTMNYWMKGKKIKVEMMNNHVLTYMDMETSTMYMYMPAANMAYKMVFDAGQVPDNPNEIMDHTPHIIGTETIDGKECTVVEYDYGGTYVKSWIWNDKGFPVRMETTTDGVTSITVWENFDFSDIADSEFELPDGVEIVEMNT